jgi:hypothetical protein
VATAQGEQSIGALHVGEKVWSYNPQTKMMELEPIQKVWLNYETDLMDVMLVASVKGPDGKITQQKEVIHTNEKHPFLTKEKGFIPVSQLKPGMHVREANGNYGVVAKLVVVPGGMWMYNLTVEQDHTYAVGVAHWIVHNCPNGDDGGDGSNDNNGGLKKGQSWTGNEQRPTLYRWWNGDGPPPGNDLRYPGNPAKPNATTMDVIPDANGNVQPGQGYSTSTKSGNKGTWYPIPGDQPLPPGLRATYDGGGHVTVGPDWETPIHTLVNLWDMFMEDE